MNLSESEYKVLLGESFQNEKNTILLEDLNKLYLCDNKANNIKDMNDVDMYLDNVMKQIRIKNKDKISKYNYKEKKEDYSFLLIKKDEHYVIERISNSYKDFNEIKDVNKSNEVTQKHELSLYGDDSDSDPDDDAVEAFYS